MAGIIDRTRFSMDAVTGDMQHSSGRLKLPHNSGEVLRACKIFSSRASVLDCYRPLLQSALYQRDSLLTGLVWVTVQTKKSMSGLWMGVVVNLPTEYKNGLNLGENGSCLKEKYSQFNPLGVHALWNFLGYTGNAVVDFKKDWSGFQDALDFARHFVEQQHGRKQWRQKNHPSSGIYGWLACADDYKSSGVIGDHLRENGDLKTVSELLQEHQNAAPSDSLQTPSLVEEGVDENVLGRMDEQKIKKKQFLDEMEKQFDAKQKLESEIEQLNIQLGVLKHMEDPESQKKTDEMKAVLEDKEEEIRSLEALNIALIVQERRTNDELQDARQELINGLSEILTGRTVVGVKRMGDINIKPFESACKRKFSGKGGIKASELCSLWQHTYFKDSQWHPFKMVTVEGKTDEFREIIDQDDERLKSLKEVWGTDVYQAVTKALMEMNEYNPSGRECFPEFWHNEENRKATLKEVVEYVMKKWVVKKRKRT